MVWKQYVVQHASSQGGHNVGFGLRFLNSDFFIGLLMFLHFIGVACSFSGTGLYLNMKSAYMTIWTGFFETIWSGKAVPPLLLSDNLIYRFFFFSLECHKEPCIQHIHQFLNGIGGTNIHCCSYDPQIARCFLKYILIHVASVSRVHTFIYLFCMCACVIKCFTLHSMLLLSVYKCFSSRYGYVSALCNYDF